jgi:hypothetical protein
MSPWSFIPLMLRNSKKIIMALNPMGGILVDNTSGKMQLIFSFPRRETKRGRFRPFATPRISLIVFF